jgi:CheY-like chemotaxis protein
MNTAHIVLIEDNSADVLLVEMALKENGIPYELTRFKNGQAALDFLCAPAGTAANAFHPDCILLDLNTPKSDGFEVLGKLRLNPYLADVPIAIITSSQARSDKHRTSLMGAVRYIEKPSQLEEFLSTVGRAVKEMLQA